MKSNRIFFPIKYLRKGLFSNNDTIHEINEKKKGKRRIRKPTLSTHIKTGKNWGKIK